MRAPIAILAGALTFPALGLDLVGSVVPPYPEGMTSDMGACVAVGEDICPYSIASLNDSEGEVVAIVAERFIGDVEGPAISEIVDAIGAPRSQAGSIWAFEECWIDGARDPALIGLVRYEDMGGWIEARETVWAVRLDIRSETLMEVDAARVRCVLPGS